MIVLAGHRSHYAISQQRQLVGYPFIKDTTGGKDRINTSHYDLRDLSDNGNSYKGRNKDINVQYCL